MTDDSVKSALSALADGTAPETELSDDADPTGGSPVPDDSAQAYQTTIQRAVEAQRDLDVAAAFVETHGLARLQRAVETAEREESALAADGRAALSAFRAFRYVARDRTEPCP